VPRGRNDYETAQIQGRLWTPAVLRPAAWFDATDLSTITISTGVSEWRNKGVSGVSVTQGTAGSQPAYVANGINGLPVVSFDGSNDSLDNTTTGLTSGTYSGQMQVFGALHRRNTSGDGGIWFTERRSSKDLSFAAWFFSANSQNYVSSNSISGGANMTIDATSYAKTASPYIMAQRHKVGARDTLFFNGEQQTVSPQPLELGLGEDITGTAGLGLGYRPSNAFGFPGYINGYIGELIVTLDDESARDRWLIEGYLSWKWGIPLAASHPFANRPPLIGD
jgi:hypothetical protein